MNENKGFNKQSNDRGQKNGNSENNMQYYYGDPMLNHPEIKKFNWGAFADPVFWGIGNRAYMALLSLIPFAGFVFMFVSGFKGNQWAWEAGNYKSIEEFKMVQDTWNRAGFARFIYTVIMQFVMIILFYILFFLMIALIGSLEEMGYYSDMYY